MLVVVHIVTLKHLSQASEDYPDAANEIKTWAAIVKAVRWRNFPEVQGTFKDADNVQGYVIFNIRQNRYRLITVIHYAKTTAQKRHARPRLYPLVFDAQGVRQTRQLGQGIW